jgi:hypothetical protein
MTGLTSLSQLEGLWRLDRRIRHSDGAENRFEGISRFSRSGKRLVQDEEGHLTGVAGQPGLKATRRYVWMLDSQRIEVLFHDMRPFHTIPTGVVCPETTYLCSPDRYHVAYDFSDMAAWRAQWRVEGPKKSYVMDSTFHRMERER